MTLDWTILWDEAGLLILQGLAVTLKLSGWALLFASFLGLVFGTVRWLDLRPFRPICWLYVEFARNTPPVVQLLFWYFSASYLLPRPLFMSLRDLGYEFGAAVIALAIYHGAFISEVVRAGLSSVPKGQLEAARALGMSFVQLYRKIILPQALRIATPPLVNEAISLVKNTSLAMAIGVTELTYQYKHVDTFMFRGVEALAAVTVVYLILCLGLAGVGNVLSARLSAHERRGALTGPILTSE